MRRRPALALDEPYGDVSLFPLTPLFDGPDLQRADHERLTKQHERVLAVLRSGGWWTLRQIAERTHDPEASISAQIRHLRKVRFGSHVISREHRGGGVYVYRLVR